MSKVVSMGCGVIQDLLPLYIDKCCSEESIEIVESHLAECEECKSVFDSMSSDAMSEEKNVSVPHKLSRINDWKASVLQTVLLFVSFAVLAVGITFAFLKVDILLAITLIGITTFAFSAAGIKIGSVFGAKYKSKAEFFGGAVLIFLGIKILIEHLFFGG